MTALDRLRRSLELMPPGSLVPVDWIREHLVGDPIAEPTVEEIAGAYGRHPSTVRGWCRAGKLPGAYRLNGREWRVPRAALEALQNSDIEGPAVVRSDRGRPKELGSWRQHVPCDGRGS